MVKYLIMDVDGTITDGKIYMGSSGEAMKAFSVKDGMVIKYILKPADIIPIIITARNSMIVHQRCSELGITEVHQGILDKFSTVKEIVGEDNLGQCAYFGDDLLDLQCMLPIKKSGGIVGCPGDAVKQVKAVADYVCVNKAGEGALREFSEWLVSDKTEDGIIKERLNQAVSYLKKISVNILDVGKKFVVNENFYYTVQSYDTKNEENSTFESHRKYIDIQIMISGREYMDLADISRLSIKELYNEDKDVMFWHTPSRLCRTTLTAGDCIIIYPEMAHRGAMIVDEKEHVIKVVGKVRID